MLLNPEAHEVTDTTCKHHSGICKSVKDVELKQKDRNDELIRVWKEFDTKVSVKLFFWLFGIVLTLILSIGTGIFTTQVVIGERIHRLELNLVRELGRLEVALDASQQLRDAKFQKDKNNKQREEN